MTFTTAKEVQAAIKAGLTKDVASYIAYLDHQSPIVSNSHLRLRDLYLSYGRAAVDAEMDLQFNTAKEG